MQFKDNPAITWQKFNESLWTTQANLWFIHYMQKNNFTTPELNQKALILQDLINHGYLYQKPHTNLYLRQKPNITYPYPNHQKGSH